MGSASLKVSVIIATYNRRNDLKDCLNSLMKQTYRNFELVVVDDGSTNGTEKLVAYYPIKYIKIKHMGQAKAENVGVRNATGEAIALLDDDCIASKNWLENLVRCHGKGIGVVGGRILDAFGEWRRTVDVDVSSGNMFLPKKVFKEIGMFDENYKGDSYKFESDFCLRLLKKGYRIVYEPKAIVWHKSSPRGTMGVRRRSSSQRFFHARNYMYFYLKNCFAIVRIPKFMVLELKRFLGYILDALLNGEPNVFLGCFEGLRTFLFHYKDIRKQGYVVVP